MAKNNNKASDSIPAKLVKDKSSSSSQNKSGLQRNWLIYSMLFLGISMILGAFLLPETNRSESTKDTQSELKDVLSTALPEQEGDCRVPGVFNADMTESETHCHIPKTVLGNIPAGSHQSISIDGADKATAKFYNPLNETVLINWVDFEGNEQTHCTLAPGERCLVWTFQGHSWLRRIESSNELDSTFFVHVHPFKIHYHFGDNEFPDQESYGDATGKHWLNPWPRSRPNLPMIDPIRIGHVRHQKSSYPHSHKLNPSKPLTAENAVSDESLDLVIETRAMRPKVFYIDNFLSEEECDYFVEYGISKGMKRSTIVSKVKPNSVNKDRTSTGQVIHAFKDDIITNITKRAYEILQLPNDHRLSRHFAESVQIVHYGPQQQYRPHLDYFSPFDNSRNHMKEYIRKGFNRFVTFFLYLNDVEEGGHTTFPHEGGGRKYPDFCNREFSVKPKKGAAAFWYSMDEYGNLDYDSLHGGCPVIKGEKWGANFWVWDPFLPIPRLVEEYNRS